MRSFSITLTQSEVDAIEIAVGQSGGAALQEFVAMKAREELETLRSQRRRELQQVAIGGLRNHPDLTDQKILAHFKR